MSDDFAEAVKRILASRVANRCSNPRCRALTSGPQSDPTKALNVGVAAHITAAAPGGPRYDPSLSPDERSGHENGIWLCQTDAKLVDNDPPRYTVETLREWKQDAEREALEHIGRTQTIVQRTAPAALRVGRRVLIRPVIPRSFENEQFIVKEVNSEYFRVEKPSSGHEASIPTDAVDKIRYTGGDVLPPWLMLEGRLQYLTRSKRWVYLPEQPPFGSEGEYGSWKTVWMFGLDADTREAINRVQSAWVLEGRLTKLLSEGWMIYYDEDGRYFRNPDPTGDLILIYKST